MNLLQKLKTANKTKLIIIASSILVVVVGVVLYLVLHDSMDFYTKLLDQTKQGTGNFRYVIEVRSSEHSESKADLDSYMAEGSSKDSKPKSDYEEVKDLEAQGTDTALDATAEQDEGKNTSWGTADGADAEGGWDYPNYTITLSGRVESVSPLTGKMTVDIATDKIKDTFFDVIVLEDKTYINLGQMRKWLKDSQNKYLISLADEIPDNVNYAEIKSDDCDFASFYAQAGTKDSGTVGMENAYNRMRLLANCCVQVMQKQFTTLGLDKTDDRYTFNVSSDADVRRFVSTLRSTLGNSGVYFDDYVASLEKNKLASKDELKQLKSEKSAFVDSFSGVWSDLSKITSTEDYKSLDLQLQGWAKKLETKGVYESNLGVSYTKDNTDYIITVYSSITPLKQDDVSVKAPSGGTKTDIGKFDCSDFLCKMLEYFNISDFHTDSSRASGVEGVLQAYKDALIDDLNDINRGNPAFVHLTRENIDEFIAEYSDSNLFSMNTVYKRQMYARVAEYKNDVAVLYGFVPGDDYLDRMSGCEGKVEGVSFKIEPYAYKKYTDDYSVLAYNVTLENKTSKIVSLDLTKFSLELSSYGSPISVFDANDVQGLQALDNSVYADNITTAIDIDAEATVDTMLFYIVDSSSLVITANGVIHTDGSEDGFEVYSNPDIMEASSGSDTASGSDASTYQYKSADDVLKLTRIYDEELYSAFKDWLATADSDKRPFRDTAFEDLQKSADTLYESSPDISVIEADSISVKFKDDLVEVLSDYANVNLTLDELSTKVDKMFAERLGN